MSYSMWRDGELTDAGAVIVDLALEVGCAAAARALEIPGPSVRRAAAMAHGINGKLKDNPKFMKNVPHNKNFEPTIPLDDERIAKPCREARKNIVLCTDDWWIPGVGYDATAPTPLPEDFVASSESLLEASHGVRIGHFAIEDDVKPPADRKKVLASLDAPVSSGLDDIQNAISQTEAALTLLDGLKAELDGQLGHLAWLQRYFRAKEESGNYKKQAHALEAVVQALKLENQALADHLAGRKDV